MAAGATDTNVLICDYPRWVGWTTIPRLQRAGWDGTCLFLGSSAGDLAPVASVLPHRWRFVTLAFLLGVATWLIGTIVFWGRQRARKRTTVHAVFSRAERGGLSLVEVVVAIGIVGLLMSIFAPAVLRMRETARQVECKSHLRQIQIACENYQILWRRYPGQFPGAQAHRSDGTLIGSLLDFHHTSVHASLLPHLDQAALFDEIRMPEAGLGALDEPPTSRENPNLMRLNVPVFVCPSDSVPSGGTSYRGCAGTTPLFHVRPDNRHPDPILAHVDAPRAGVFSRGPKSPAEISDGLSATAFFSERFVGDGRLEDYTPWRDIARVSETGPFPNPNDVMAACLLAGPLSAPSGKPPYSFAGWTWLQSKRYHTYYNHVLAPNARIPDCVIDGSAAGDLASAAVSARSPHERGVHVAFGDGAVKLISNDVDLTVWRAMGTINGREVIAGTQ